MEMKKKIIRNLFSLGLLGVFTLSSTACQWDDVDSNGDLKVTYFTPTAKAVGMLECSKDGSNWRQMGWMVGLGSAGTKQWNAKYPANPVYDMTMEVTNLFSRSVVKNNCTTYTTTRWADSYFWISNGRFYQKQKAYTTKSAEMRVFELTTKKPQSMYFTDEERVCFDGNDPGSDNLWTRALECDTDKTDHFTVSEQGGTLTETVDLGPECKPEPTNWYQAGLGYACTTMCLYEPEGLYPASLSSPPYSKDGGVIWYADTPTCGASDDDDSATMIPIPLGAIYSVVDPTYDLL